MEAGLPLGICQLCVGGAHSKDPTRMKRLSHSFQLRFPNSDPGFTSEPRTFKFQFEKNRRHLRGLRAPPLPPPPHPYPHPHPWMKGTFQRLCFPKAAKPAASREGPDRKDSPGLVPAVGSSSFFSSSALGAPLQGSQAGREAKSVEQGW